MRNWRRPRRIMTEGMHDEDELAKAVSVLESDRESPGGKLLRAVLEIVSG